MRVYEALRFDSCLLNSREDVVAVTLVQKKRAQTERLIGATGGAGHVFSAVPTRGVVQSACGSPALRRNPDPELRRFTTLCEYEQVSSFPAPKSTNFWDRASKFLIDFTVWPTLPRQSCSGRGKVKQRCPMAWGERRV